MKQLRCPSCGAPVERSSVKCTYCGAFLTEDEEKNKTTQQSERQKKINDITDNVFNTIDHVSKKVEAMAREKREEMSVRKEKSNFSVLLFIILLIILPPVGILYLIFHLIFNGGKK